jgi:ABC-type multidrug transport system fused ATPase/permease subunit
VGGRQVSAGERQRIALARAVLRDASLQLLDEPTSHLDDATEAIVVEALGRALAGRSALIVTHRPAVVRLADRVVTLEGGRFVATEGADVGAGTAGAVQGLRR